MSSSAPERALRWAVAIAVCGVFACDAGVGDGVEGADPLAGVERPDWDETRRDAEEQVPVEGDEARDEVVDDARDEVVDDGGDEVVDDPAAPYLPIPSGTLGGARPAKVTLPDDYDPAVAWPLVMLLHGYSADGFIQDFYLGVGAQADARDFIFILPDGTKNSQGKGFWNAVPGCCNWDGSDVDDYGYLVGLVEEAMVKYHVDASRVAVMGHSNGGYMSHRLACDRSDLFTAVASIAGTSYADLATQCEATEPVSVLQIHGTLDATVSYDTPFAGVGAEETVAWWKDRAGCDPGGDLGDRDYDAMIAGAETRCTGWSGCESGVQVEIWKMLNSGHIPIFTEDFMPDVLDFLLGHPRP